MPLAAVRVCNGCFDEPELLEPINGCFQQMLLQHQLEVPNNTAKLGCAASCNPMQCSATLEHFGVKKVWLVSTWPCWIAASSEETVTKLSLCWVHFQSCGSEVHGLRWLTMFLSELEQASLICNLLADPMVSFWVFFFNVCPTSILHGHAL